MSEMNTVEGIEAVHKAGSVHPSPLHHKYAPPAPLLSPPTSFWMDGFSWLLRMEERSSME